MAQHNGYRGRHPNLKSLNATLTNVPASKDNRSETEVKLEVWTLTSLLDNDRQVRDIHRIEDVTAL